MRGLHHVRTRHVTSIMLGSALLIGALPGASAVVATDDAAALPECQSLDRTAARDGEVVSPWSAVLDEDGVVMGYRLTLRHEGIDHRLETGPRGFSMESGARGLLIGERSG